MRLFNIFKVESFKKFGVYSCNLTLHSYNLPFLMTTCESNYVVS